MTPPDSHRPWYREPMMWVVITLPLIVVIASFVTLSMALRSSGSADSVRDPVQRVGKGQTIDLAPDQAAAARGLRLRLRLSPDTESIEAELLAGELSDHRLSLLLIHPAQASEDLQTELIQASPGRFFGRMAVAREHAWNVYLSAADGGWRVQGRLDAQAAETVLTPAVDAPPAAAPDSG
ncbi:MAG: FixH family protein [Lysobacteraceae bacterium]